MGMSRAIMLSRLNRVTVGVSPIVTRYNLVLNALLRWKAIPPSLVALLGYEALESEVQEQRLWRWISKNGK